MIRQSHYSTPKNSRIRGTISYLEAFDIPHFKSRVFAFHGASKRSGYRALEKPESEEYDADRTFHSTRVETRGRKKKLSDEDLAIIERFIESNGYDGRTITWAGLPAAAGLDTDCCAETVRRALKTLDCRFCIAYEKKYYSPRLKERRSEYCRTMLERYPHKTDWYRVRFSDECHFGWGPAGRVRILRRPGKDTAPIVLLRRGLRKRRIQSDCTLGQLLAIISSHRWFGTTFQAIQTAK